MLDTSTHLAHVRAKRPYRTGLLWGLVMLRADDTGTYCPRSFAELRRELATGEQTQATPEEVKICVRQAIAQGMLTQDSDPARLVLTGMEVAE